MRDAGCRSRLRWLGLLVGGGLTVAALILALRDVNLATLAAAQWWQVAAIAGLVAVNLALSSVLWWVLALSFDARTPVTLGRMMALISASALLNYLPLRAGMLGRAAYLRAVHGVPLIHSALMAMLVFGLSGAVLGAAAAVVTVIPPDAQLGVAGAATVLAALAGPIAARRVIGRFVRRRPVAAWTWAPLRIADLMVTAGRLWVAFAIVGHPIPFEQATLAAAAGVLLVLIGVTPNGLGLREWAIGAVAAPAVGGGAALAAALVDRAIEAVVIAAAGVWGMRAAGMRLGARTEKPEENGDGREVDGRESCDRDGDEDERSPR